MAAGNEGVLMQRSRWLALFVALALVGVLLAAQAAPSDSAAPGDHASSSNQPASRQAAHGTSPGSTSTTSGAHTGQVHLRDTTTAATSTSPTDAGSWVGTSDATTAANRTAGAPNTTTTVPATTATLDLTPKVASPVRTENGWLAGPTSVSASYAIDAGADAIVSFSGAAALTLDASCPSGNRSVTGPSPLTLAGLTAGCWVTISGPASMPTTTYALRLAPR